MPVTVTKPKITSHIIAFGDIHGCYQAAQTAISLAEDIQAQAIFLGDYVDRGKSAVKTVNLLIEAKAKHSGWVFLRGNHDQMLLSLIDKRYRPEDYGKALGYITYNLSQAEDSYNEWQSYGNVEQEKVTAFLNSTELFYEIEKYIFLHGILRNTEQNITEKSEDELLWNYETEPLWYGKWFIHGHWPTDRVSIYGKGINLNTRCGYNGTLTGLLIDAITAKPIKTFTISEDGRLLKEETFSLSIF
jgi:serine/threonine protein phosphatase 1